MKLAIIGTRDITTPFEYAVGCICDFVDRPITQVVSGGAKTGGDRFAEVFNDYFNLPPPMIFYADWKKYHMRAGFERNTLIAEYCDECIAFWDGHSRGTADTLDKIKRLKKRFRIINI